MMRSSAECLFRRVQPRAAGRESRRVTSQSDEPRSICAEPFQAALRYDIEVPPAKEVSIGAVLFRVTEDVVFLQPVGDFTIELAQQFIMLIEEVLAQYGRSFILADLQRAGPIPVDARRRLAQFAAANPPLAVAMYHVSPFIRGVNALLFGAMRIFSKNRQNVMQFSGEEDAVRWLNGERKRMVPQ